MAYSRVADDPLPSDDRYSQGELEALLHKATDYDLKHSQKHGDFGCEWLYRDKSPEYYDEINKKHAGWMIKYMKDNNGDPRNPINCRLKGLFFGANVAWKTGEPLNTTVYGARRLKLRAKKLVGLAPNLYFSDFYCSRVTKDKKKKWINRPHFVTLVMTETGSSADDFCQSHLIPLDLHDNPFFYASSDGCRSNLTQHDDEEEEYSSDEDPWGWYDDAQMMHRDDGMDDFFCVDDVESDEEEKPYDSSQSLWVTSGVWVELLFTRNFNIRQNLKEGLEKMQMIGTRTGGSIGLRKNMACRICNL